VVSVSGPRSTLLRVLRKAWETLGSRGQCSFARKLAQKREVRSEKRADSEPAYFLEYTESRIPILRESGVLLKEFSNLS
jgi:hypothetical protein